MRLNIATCKQTISMCTSSKLGPSSRSAIELMGDKFQDSPDTMPCVQPEPEP